MSLQETYKDYECIFTEALGHFTDQRNGILHLSLESIIDLLEGRSEDKHPDQCPECRGRMEEWSLLRSRLHRKQLLTDAPAEVLKTAYGIPAPRPGVGQVLASRIFDSFSQPAFAGARGSGESRQMLRTAEIDIHVRISGKPGSLQIAGQVLTRSENAIPDTARVHLLQNGERIQSAELNLLGEFEFEHAPEGLLSLQVDLPSGPVFGPLGNEEVAG